MGFFIPKKRKGQRKVSEKDVADFSDALNSLPPSIIELIKFVVTSISPEKVILFGSRARKTHRENSDFDLAITGEISHEKWTKLLVELEERNISLYSIDLVQIKELDENYKMNIAKDGVVIYG